MTSITILPPAVVRVPRGALWAAEIFSRVLAAFTPQRGAVVPQVPDRAAEASAVRELACSVASSDPEFAADLYAAADRHEGRVD